MAMPSKYGIEKKINSMEGLSAYENGGAGSGNFGHAGRPGKVGGSAATGSGGAPERSEGKKPKKAPEPGTTIKQTKKTQESLGDWASKNLDYPEDYVSKDLSTDEIIARMAGGEDFYEMVGQIDSIDREKVFAEMSDRLGVNYGDVYDTWLHGKEGNIPRNVREYTQSLKQSPKLRELKSEEQAYWATYRDADKPDAKLRPAEKRNDERALREMVHSVWVYGGGKDNKYLSGEGRYPSLSKKERKQAIDDEWDYCEKNLTTGYGGTDSEGVSYNYERYAPSKARGKKKNSLEEAITDAIIKTLNGGPGSGNFGHAGRPGKVGGSASGTVSSESTGSSSEGSSESDGKTVPLAQFMKTAKETPLEMKMTSFRGGEPRNPDWRGVKKVQTKGMYLEGGSYLDLPKASLTEVSWDDKTGTGKLKCYEAGYRGLNKEEKAAMAEWERISSTPEYKQRAQEDMWTDGSSTYWQEKGFWESKGLDYMFGTSKKGGKLYTQNPNKKDKDGHYVKEIQDDSIKGKLWGEYDIRKKSNSVGEKNPFLNGGAGSGNFGHAGRPGEVGGSAPSGAGGVSRETTERTSVKKAADKVYDDPRGEYSDGFDSLQRATDYLISKVGEMEGIGEEISMEYEEDARKRLGMPSRDEENDGASVYMSEVADLQSEISSDVADSGLQRLSEAAVDEALDCALRQGGVEYALAQSRLEKSGQDPYEAMDTLSGFMLDFDLRDNYGAKNFAESGDFRTAWRSIAQELADNIDDEYGSQFGRDFFDIVDR